MKDNRSLKLDLFALGLLALVVFLTLALFTYNPADPVVELVAPLNRLFQPDTLVYPQNDVVQNACGQWGSLIASMLLTGLGIGAYYLVISLGALDVLLLMRRRIDVPTLRAFGWMVSLIGLTTVAALIVPSWSPGPVIGSGGYLGALGAGLLKMNFATVGAMILSTSLILGGLLLCTDYALFHIASQMLQFAGSGVARGRSLVPTRATTRRPKQDVSKAELAVKIGGKTVEDEVLEDEQEEEGEWVSEEAELEEEEDQDDAECEVVVRGKTMKLRTDKGNQDLPIRRRKNRAERQQVMQRLDEASLSGDTHDYELPSLDLLLESNDICFEAQTQEVKRKARILEKTFANFGFRVRVVEVETGPVIAQYEIELEAGLRLSRITGLADDLAIALRVPSVRIVAPIPGKNTVGIEVPNEARQMVRLREVMEETNGRVSKMRIPLFLGKDVSGKPLTVDLADMPHLLIAGRTGTGKSVCLNAIITSILMTRRPEEVRMLMIDPKMVELSGYSRLPHLMHPVVTDMRKAEAILAWTVEKMEERYSLLARSGVRHITSYNQLGIEELAERLQPESDEEREAIPDQLPFIVVIADEIADLMLTAGKEVEQHIIRLAQKSRAVGIHLVLATQKPTVDVITGLIKSNLPARISFQVASRTDSRVVLDEMGADRLLGNGDMLFLVPGTSMLKRGQGTFLTDEEINAIVDQVSTDEQNYVSELVNMKVERPDEENTAEKLRKRDELYESAVDVVVREGRGSVSLLQRTLGIGYGRAARLIDFMAEDGIVGEYNGSQAREVLLSPDDWNRMQGLDTESTPAPKPRRSNVIRPEGDGWMGPEENDLLSPEFEAPTHTASDSVPFDPDEELDEEVEFRQSESPEDERQIDDPLADEPGEEEIDEWEADADEETHLSVFDHTESDVEDDVEDDEEEYEYQDDEEYENSSDPESADDEEEYEEDEEFEYVDETLDGEDEYEDDEYEEDEEEDEYEEGEYEEDEYEEDEYEEDEYDEDEYEEDEGDEQEAAAVEEESDDEQPLQQSVRTTVRPPKTLTRHQRPARPRRPLRR